MKWLGRSFAFALAAAFGITAAWFGSLFSSNLNLPDSSISFSYEAEPVNASSPSGIAVTYAGMDSDPDGGLYLRFIIYNGIRQPVSYPAHSSESPFPKLEINGKEIPQLGRCGTGMRSFYVLPGRSAEVRVYRHEFLKIPQSGDRITVGFYLKPSLTGEYAPHFSEPFSLPEEFREAIKARFVKNG